MIVNLYVKALEIVIKLKSSDRFAIVISLAIMNKYGEWVFFIVIRLYLVSERDTLCFYKDFMLCV